MMKRFPVKAAIVSGILLPLFLTACSSNDSYLQAKTLPPITVPDGLDDQALGQIYRVPEGDGRIASGELKKPLPPTLGGRQGVAEPRVQSSAGKAWLVVPKEASATWSQLLIYLQSRKIRTVTNDVFSAEVQTSWVSEGASPRTAYRYKLHLEAGLQPDLTEIHAVNISGQVTDALAPQSVWPEETASLSHQTWFLKEIARAINVQKSLGDSLIASSISLPRKVSANSIGGEPVIEFSRIEADRSYHAMTNALSRAPFIIYDDSRSDGVFYFDEYKPQGDKPRSWTQTAIGWISFSGSKNNSEKTSPYNVSDLLSHLPAEDEVSSLFGSDVSTNSKKLSRVRGYLLIIKNAGGKQRAYIRDGYGRLLEPAKSKLLLDTIRKQLF